MKKLFALALVVFGLAACQTDPSDLNVDWGGEQDAVVTVALPANATRSAGADSALGAIDNGIDMNAYDIRFMLEVYDATGELAKERMTVTGDETSASFSLRLVPGRNYNFVAWADFVAEGTVTDLHYNTADLANIYIIGEQKLNDESRDAYTAFKEISYDSYANIELTLTRPFAKLRVVTTDMNELYSDLVSATVKYTSSLYTSFNALTATPGNLAGNIEKTITYSANNAYSNEQPDADGKMTLFADYFFGAENNAALFTLDVDDDTNETIPTIVFNTNIPVKRNYVTTIAGNILTDGNNVNVTIEDAFENVDDNGNTTDPDYEYETISSVAEFYTAVAKLDAGGEYNYVVISDLNIDTSAVTSLAATRSNDTKKVTINLNGRTITVNNQSDAAFVTLDEGETLVLTGEGSVILSAESTASFIQNNGTLTIEGGEVKSDNNNTCVITNNGEANISGGELKENAITNNGTTNVSDGKINEDAITNTTEGITNITGGEFTYTPDADEIEDGYEVKTDENGNITVEPCDPVAQIGNEVYTTLQAAFDAVENNQTIEILRDAIVKNTVVLAEGKAAVLNLNGYTLSAADKNVIRNDGGNLTIKNGTVTRTGDIVGYSVNNASGEITVENVTIARGLYTSGSKMTATNANISHEQSSRHAIYAWNCEVTINSGTYNNDNAGNATLMASGSSVVTINGGTFSIADGRSSLGWTSSMIDQNGTAKVIVKAGLFNGGFRINSADTTLTIEGGEFNTNNGSGYTDYSGTKVVKGGKFTDAGALNWAKKYIAEGYILDGDTVVLDVKVAKVGNTEYRKIDEAIAAWTNNTTLTLLSDVTLSDVITLKSTEHHILNLGTYTLTAASGKHAIEITCNGLSNATYALTINADTTNPGGITATGKSCIYYKKSDSTKDRPIILINNGVFTGSYSINSTSNGNTNCPQIWINGGVFNSYMNLTKNMLRVSGGTFHGAINCTGDSSAYREIKGGRFKSWQFMTADASSKFWVGTAKETYDVGVYVDDEGYLVVGGPVITEFGDKFAAKATNPTKWSSYLKYSSAATYGLYYTNAEMAIKKHGEANVVLPETNAE